MRFLRRRRSSSRSASSETSGLSEEPSNYREAGKEALEDLVRHLVPQLPLEERAQLHNKGMPRQWWPTV